MNQQLYPLLRTKNALHLAVALKKLLTILLLFLLAGHVTAGFYLKGDNPQWVKNTQEKKEKNSSEEKQEGEEFTACSGSANAGAVLWKKDFVLHLSPPLHSPLIECHTPPPDKASVV